MMGLFKKFGLVKNKSKNTFDNSVVVFAPSKIDGATTYSEFYSVHICPKCYSVLDHYKARYVSNCCYKCGYSNCSVLFDPQKVIVRDVYVDGKKIETIVSERI